MGAGWPDYGPLIKLGVDHEHLPCTQISGCRT